MLASGDLLGSAGHDDPTTGVTAFRTKVNDMIGSLDDVHVVFDHNDGMSGIDQPIQTFKQALDVSEMKSGSGLVEDIKRVLRPL